MIKNRNRRAVNHRRIDLRSSGGHNPHRSKLMVSIVERLPNLAQETDPVIAGQQAELMQHNGP